MTLTFFPTRSLQVTSIIQNFPEMESKLSQMGKGSTVPQEERKMKDFFPDLIPTLDLPIDMVSTSDANLLHQFFVEQPLPPLKVEFTKPIPTSNVRLVDSEQRRRETLPLYAIYTDPTEDELATRVEYDMDDVDSMWLQELNKRLEEQKEQPCSADVFEFVMDRLEKEWFDLTKDIPRQILSATTYLEDKCAVCDDDEAENSNAIVFCDGCNLAVHQECYGIPFIPEGQWLCRRCMICPGRKVSCVVCPSTDGAMKQTTQNRWCHLVCAIWIPECSIQNTIFMEPIEGIETIPKNRWKLTCYICQQRYGAPIQCSTKNCFVAFHPTCARKAKLCMNMRGTESGDANGFRAYCDKHTPKDFKGATNLSGLIRSTALELQGQQSETSVTNFKECSSSGQKRGNLVSLHSPIVPEFVLQKVLDKKLSNYPKLDMKLIILIAKYWSLKKESLKGAPLLRRLHIEVIIIN